MAMLVYWSVVAKYDNRVVEANTVAVKIPQIFIFGIRRESFPKQKTTTKE